MPDTSQNIENIYQEGLRGLEAHKTALDIWRETALELAKQNISLQSPPQFFNKQPVVIIYYNLKKGLSKLQNLNDFLLDKKIIIQHPKEYSTNFSPNFSNNGQIPLVKIKCFSAFKMTWVLFILQEISVLQIKGSFKSALIHHLKNRDGSLLNDDTIDTYLTRINNAVKRKEYPDFKQDLILIFSE